jgi:Uma2 family endonuclease
MAVTQQKLSLEEFLKLPGEKPALEFLEGTVRQKVSPKARHSKLQRKLVDFINAFAEPRQLAEAFPELRLTFAGESPVPDVAVLRWNNIPYDDQGFPVDDLFQAPDIAIEIVSPDQSVTSLVRKCLWYVANGVAVALLVDPDDESVLAFRKGQEPRAPRDSDRIDLDEVMLGFPLTVQELFGALRRA